jgi:hypothetical protein
MRQVDEGERLELAEAAHVHLHLKALLSLIQESNNRPSALAMGNIPKTFDVNQQLS